MTMSNEQPDQSGGTPPDRDSGLPGGGKGRIDRVERTPVYPATGPYPPGEADIRTPGEFVHGQTDESGRPVEGGSEPILTKEGFLIGGPTPPSSSPPAKQPSQKP